MSRKIFFSLLVFILAIQLVAMPAHAQDTVTDISAEVTADDLGASESSINSAADETTVAVEETGTLIEIGNTTADETTIIIRVTDDEGNTADETVEISTDTSVLNDSFQTSDLSDWIAGDQITYTVDQNADTGEKKAKVLRNRSFRRSHRGRNGWIKEIRVDQNEIDVEWAGKIYTLNVNDARMVAGLKNPAVITDFEVGDRIRARVVNDGDGNELTWNATIVVVLRRGSSLFMRVTRWVVPAKITAIPEDLTLPVTIEVEILPSKFYEEGDVNNLIGAPGDILEVDIDDSTRLRRRFFGKSLLREYSEGDVVRIVGRLNETTGRLDAKMIKNNSIQRLNVSHHLGRVTALDAGTRSITVQLLHSRIAQKTWVIHVLDDTNIVEKGEDRTFNDIQLGDILRVRGTANRLQKTVEANRVSIVTERFNSISN